MTRRLLLSYLAVTVVVLLLLEIPLAMFYSQRELDRFTTALERDATVLTTIYEDDLEQGRPLDPAPAVRYSVRSGARVVVVDRQGVSLVDTGEAVPRDFSTRPEIAAALGGTRATGKRSSSTLGTNIVYVALPVGSSSKVHGALRLTLDTAALDSNVHRFWLGLVAIALVVLAMVVMVGWAIARWITRPLRALQQSADRFAHGDLTPDEVVDSGPPELRQLSGTMSDMALRLNEMLEEQREFIADASHQLRTPLTAMRLRLENLQARLPEADAVEVEAAIDETTRLALLVGDLLQLARADSAVGTSPVDIGAVAGDRIDTWSAVAELHDVRLEIRGTGAPVMAMAVPGALEQILDNTLDNAMTVTPPGGVVTVVVEQGAATHRVSVVDHGPGLSDDDKVRALRRFWRGTSTAPGTGLGLAIAEALASASGGSLTLLDTPGGGLTVELVLPVAR
ncbi:MAG: ATP-binding protein [Actinomycetota bacterium]